jgi:hypothetical protein
MFKPLRFNELLKAIPGLAHLQLTPDAAPHAKSGTYARVKEKIEVDRVRATRDGVKETRIRKEREEAVEIEHRPRKDKDEENAPEPRARKDKEQDGEPEHRARKNKDEDNEPEHHARKDKDEDDNQPAVRRRVTEKVEVERVERKKDGEEVSETLTRVHTTTFDVAEVEMTPPHAPREETPLYARTHRALVYTLDTPCAICGVRQSTLDDPKQNLFGAKAIETHHYPIERSLMNACDPKKVGVIFPHVKNYETLEEFIDSDENMMVLCDIHHRHPHYGIHHVLAQDFFIQPFLYKGYQVVADEDDADKVRATNERVLKRFAPKENE